MTEVNMEPREKILVDEYGFIVSTKDLGGNVGHFVVVDPKLPKKKGRQQGGNLYVVLCQACDARAAYEMGKKDGKITRDVNLWNADLRSANLRDADLGNANLWNAKKLINSLVADKKKK